MIKPSIRAAFAAIGYDPPRKTLRRFTISGLQYEADPCSGGQAAHGESTAVWFLENGEAATEHDLLPFAANPQLKYVGQRSEPLVPKCFWMMTKRV